MKAAYAPFNPDLEDLEAALDADDLAASAQRLADELGAILELGSYHAVPPEDIDRAFREAALVDIPMSVDFEAFDELLIYARGRQTSGATVRRGLLRRRRTVAIDAFERVCTYVRFKDGGQLTPR